MLDRDILKKRILCASGNLKAELVIKNAKIINVFSEEIEEGDIGISDGEIIGIGKYEGEEVVDIEGRYVCPGFIDGHIHLESSMVSPYEFEKAVITHGTTAVVTDPHEIANVSGTEGIQYMMNASALLDIDVFFMLPSCVPATDLDESGAVLLARQLKPFYSESRVLGLAEMMNAYGVVCGDENIMDKIVDAAESHKMIDGHAPGLSGKSLNAYITSGVSTDHECSNMEEALEKLRRGQWIMVRDGTAAKNLESLIGLCKPPYYSRCLFVTDDKHPGDLMREGHIDGIVRKAIRLGADPLQAIKMGTYNAARCFHLNDRGAVAPGYSADLVIFSDIKELNIDMVFKEGVLVAKDGKSIISSARGEKNAACDMNNYLKVYHSFQMNPISQKDLELCLEGKRVKVIQLIKNELLTEEINTEWVVRDGFAPGVDVERDIIKIAVFERHKASGHVGVGFMQGYGLTCGAIATSVAHDSHNLIVAGVNDKDMVLAANAVRESEGGIAIARDGEILGILPLPIGGLMSLESAAVVDAQLEDLKALARSMGVSSDIDAFMTLSFVSLPVIPKLRLNTLGLVDVDHQKIDTLYRGNQ